MLKEAALQLWEILLERGELPDEYLGVPEPGLAAALPQALQAVYLHRPGA